MTHIATKYLENELTDLDENADITGHISKADYIQIGLLLKILETLNNISTLLNQR
jgi:hypothetical protein